MHKVIFNVDFCAFCATRGNRDEMHIIDTILHSFPCRDTCSFSTDFFNQKVEVQRVDAGK